MRLLEPGGLWEESLALVCSWSGRPNSRQHGVPSGARLVTFWALFPLDRAVDTPCHAANLRVAGRVKQGIEVERESLQLAGSLLALAKSLGRQTEEIKDRELAKGAYGGVSHERLSEAMLEAIKWMVSVEVRAPVEALPVSKVS